VGRGKRTREGFAIEEVEEGNRVVGSGKEEARRLEWERGRRNGSHSEGAPRGADKTKAIAIGGGEERKDLIKELRREVGPAGEVGAGGGE
jgi:hypothetical protein